MGRDRDTDYQAKLQAAKKGSDSENNYMWGLQAVNPKYGNNNAVSYTHLTLPTKRIV